MNEKMRTTVSLLTRKVDEFKYWEAVEIREWTGEQIGRQAKRVRKFEAGVRARRQAQQGIDIFIVYLCVFMAIGTQSDSCLNKRVCEWI